MTIVDPNTFPQPSPRRLPGTRPRRTPPDLTPRRRPRPRSPKPTPTPPTRGPQPSAARVGGLLASAGIFVFEKVVERLLEIQDEETDALIEAQNRQIEAKLARRAREKQLRTTHVQRTESAPGPAEPLGRSQPRPDEVPVPPARPDIRFDQPPEIEPGIPEAIPPVPRIDPGPIAEPIPPADPAPAQRPGDVPQVDPGFDPLPGFDPVPDAPGFGVPEIVSPFPRPIADPFGFPSPIPFAAPGTLPRGTPVGDIFSPRGLPGFPGQRLTDFDPRVIEFPQPQPLPQPNPNRRCKPCPEEKEPLPREECWKGLYKEGRMDDDVSFRQWARVDCETGKELTPDEIAAGDSFDFTTENVINLFT